MQPILFKLGGTRLNINGTGIRNSGVPPNLVGGRLMVVPATWTITGISRDSTGAALGGVTCTLFWVRENGTFMDMGSKVSDSEGRYAFTVLAPPDMFRVTFDLAGSPDRAGITLKTLTGV